MNWMGVPALAAVVEGGGNRSCCDHRSADDGGPSTGR